MIDPNTIVGMVLTFISTMLLNWWNTKRQLKNSGNDLSLKLELLEQDVSDDLWKRAKAEIDDLSKSLDSERKARQVAIEQFDNARLKQKAQFEQELAEQEVEFKRQLVDQKNQFVKVLKYWQAEMEKLKGSLNSERAIRLQETNMFKDLLEDERTKRRILAVKVEQLQKERQELKNALKEVVEENIALKKAIGDCKDT